MNRIPSLRDPLPHAAHVTVFGLGWSGVAAANLLRRLGKRVTATDTRTPDALQSALHALHADNGLSLAEGVEIRCGDHQDLGADAVLLTQSVKPWQEPVQAARRRGLVVMPEIELAARALDDSLVDLVTVGGTDGKTTTTKLAFHLAAHQRRAWVGGNSWTPLSAVVAELTDALTLSPLPPGQRAALIAEVSAFQLPPWHTLSPLSATLTNIAEDHIDEYFQGSFDAYVDAKRGLIDHMGVGQTATLNIDDPRIRPWQDDLTSRGARVVRATLAARAASPHPDAAYRHNGELRLRWGGLDRSLIDQAALPLVGDHNVENTLCAAGALLPLNLDIDGMREAISSFSAPHHRLERVANIGGVEIYDDSKATNAHASMAGLAAFGHKPIVAIVGGVDKNLDLSLWVEALRSRARRVVVIGELRARLLNDHAHQLPQATPADSLADAVDLALDAARPGDILILSPACSSFDMFDSYADRGRRFQAEILKRT